MEKQKLADLVMQKMKAKKELQEKSRPHYEVLRLEVTFEKELNDQLKQEIAELQTLVNSQKGSLSLMQEHLQLDNTGKKSFPRIVILPDFIASEHIQPFVKEFYRKTSNSYLKTDILRNKAYNESVLKEKELNQRLEEIQKLQAQIRNTNEEQRKTLNGKRVKVLKEDLRLRFIREEQKQIKLTIQKQREENKDLIKQYQIKKLNLQNRKDRLKHVQQQIVMYKRKIEETFNPLTYRQHLQNVFDVQMKTQIMQKHLVEVVKNLEVIQNQTNNYQKMLERVASLTVLGRTSDSPSTKRGKIQKRLLEQKKRQSSTPRRANSMSSVHKRSVSQNSIKRERLDLDLQKIVSTAKNSQRTTDRSSHPRYHSELQRTLF